MKLSQKLIKLAYQINIENMFDRLERLEAPQEFERLEDPLASPSKKKKQEKEYDPR